MIPTSKDQVSTTPSFPSLSLAINQPIDSHRVKTPTLNKQKETFNPAPRSFALKKAKKCMPGHSKSRHSNNKSIEFQGRDKKEKRPTNTQLFPAPL